MGWISVSILSKTLLRAAGAINKPDGDEWLEGEGVAIHAQDAAPPTEHRSEAHLSLLADGTYHLAVGSAEFGNGITQCATAGRRHRARHACRNISMDFADTDARRTTRGPSPAQGQASRRGSQ